MFTVDVHATNSPVTEFQGSEEDAVLAGASAPKAVWSPTLALIGPVKQISNQRASSDYDVVSADVKFADIVELKGLEEDTALAGASAPEVVKSSPSARYSPVQQISNQKVAQDPDANTTDMPDASAANRGVLIPFERW